MSNIEWLKKHGTKILIKFDKSLIGDVTGKEDAVGGWAPGEDVAAFKPSSASNERSADYSADKAFDENEDTEWQPGYRLDNQTLTVDLEEQKDIKGFTFRRGVGGYYRTFKIEASNDNTNWDLIYQSANFEINDGYDYKNYEFATVQSYRYWRFEGWHRVGNYPSISIMQYNEKAPVGNEARFSITGQEPKWVIFPGNELGPLIDGDYEIEKVEGHPPIILHTEDLNEGLYEDVEMSEDGLILAEQGEGS